MRVLFFAFVLLAGTISISAQKVVGTTQKLPFSTTVHASNANLFHKFSRVFDNYVLNIDKEDKIVPVDMDKETWGVVRLKSNGQVAWQTKISKPEFIGMGMLEGKVIVLSKENPYLNEKLYATLIDTETGKQLSEKFLYENTSEFRIETKVQNKPDGSFNDLLVRITKRKIKGMGLGSNVLDGLSDITKTEVFFIGTDLSVTKKVDLKTSLPLETFSGSVVNNAGEIFIAGLTEDQYCAFLFTADGKEKSRVLTPLIHKYDFVPSIIVLDVLNDEALVVAMLNYPDKKSTELRLFNFDLKNRKVVEAKTVEVDKGYLKELNFDHVKGIYEGPAKIIDDLELVGLVQTKDKIAVIKEIRGSTPADGNFRARYYNNAWVLSIYDRNLQQLKTFALAKGFQAFTNNGRSIGYHLNGDRLYVVSPTVAGALSYETLFSEINLSTLNVEKHTTIDRQKIKNSLFIEAGATLWYGDNFLLQYLVPEGTVTIKAIHSILQKVQL